MLTYIDTFLFYIKQERIVKNDKTLKIFSIVLIIENLPFSKSFKLHIEGAFFDNMILYFILIKIINCNPFSTKNKKNSTYNRRIKIKIRIP